MQLRLGAVDPEGCRSLGVRESSQELSVGFSLCCYKLDHVKNWVCGFVLWLAVMLSGHHTSLKCIFETLIQFVS